MNIERYRPKIGLLIWFCHELIIPWLGRQFWNQTYEGDPVVVVDEIRELLNENELDGTLCHD